MQGSEFDETKASARLPHLDIDIIHRQARDGGSEELSVSLRATPSLRAFSQFLETANPFLFWAQLAQMAWLPWLTAFQSMPRPQSFADISAPVMISRLPERRSGSHRSPTAQHRPDEH